MAPSSSRLAPSSGTEQMEGQYTSPRSVTKTNSRKFSCTLRKATVFGTVVALAFVAGLLAAESLLLQRRTPLSVLIQHDDCPAVDYTYANEYKRWEKKVCARRKYNMNMDEKASRTTMFDPWEPEWSCGSLDRTGLRYWGEGSKWTCGLEYLADVKDCLVYSVGSGQKDGFERAIRKLAPRCEVHAFDPTADIVAMEFQAEKAGYHFHLTGIGSQKASGTVVKFGKLYTLEETMARNGHAGRRIDILKIDCEMCEWNVVGQETFGLIAEGQLQVGQLQVTLHNRGKVPLDVVTEFFRNADRADMRVFSKDKNQWECNGSWCVDYSFISGKWAETVFMRQICPYSLGELFPYGTTRPPPPSC